MAELSGVDEGQGLRSWSLWLFVGHGLGMVGVVARCGGIFCEGMVRVDWRK